MKKYDTDIINIIKQDKETKNMEFSDRDVMEIYSYIIQRDSKNYPPGYRLILRKTPYIHKVLVPEISNIEFYSAKINTLNTGSFIVTASIDEFYLTNEYRNKAILAAKDIISNYKDAKTGLLLTGNLRTGKTYLLSAIAIELAKLGYSVLFLFMSDLVRVMKDAIGLGNVENYVNLLKNCDALFLDDLGCENMSEWFRDEIFYPVLHHRSNLGKPVFISTNCTQEELLKNFAGEGNKNSRGKAARIQTRINELTKRYQIDS